MLKEEQTLDLALWLAIVGFGLAVVLSTGGCSKPTSLNLTPLVAAEAAYSCMIYDSKPEKSEVCRNCNGTGVVGDGVVERVCPVCQGNKIEPESVLLHDESQIILRETKKVEQKGTTKCTTGNCPLR